MNKKYKDKKITMAHGSGGKASSDLITDIFVNTFNNDYLATMEDQARFDMPAGQLALTTDSYGSLFIFVFFIHYFLVIKSIF